jgi:hypothetical protein
MIRRLFVLAGLVALVSATASGQAVDAHKALEAAAKTMGTNSVKTIQYSGSGTSTRVGQTYTVNEGWPTYEVADYTRSIDYDAKWSREDYTRRQGKYPTLGLTPMPEERITSILSGNYAWDMKGETPVPLTRMYLDGIPYSDLRQLEIAITPHGFLKMAMAAPDATAISLPIVGPSDFGLSAFGRRVTIVSFKMGKYRVNGTINDKNLVELTDTWYPNPMYGDMDYEMRYTQYKDHDGVMFPGLIHVHQGDPRLNPAHNYYEYSVSDVKINPTVSKMTVPEVVRTASMAPPKVQVQKLADHVWLMGGGPLNSVLVEFKDFVAVVEAPQNEARSLAVIAEIEKLFPNKMIRYVVNTNHRMDFSGGLRTYFSQGTTVVTHESNKDYYVGILFSPFPRELDPDRMATYSPMYMISRRPPPIETVGGTTMTGKYVISDDDRQMQVWHVQDMAYDLGDSSLRQGPHTADMLMAYLPKEKILINADLYAPPEPGVQPGPVTIGMKTLYQNMVKLKLDVNQHVPIVGRPGTNEEFVKLVGKTQDKQGN